jgi:hypothetical protein
MAHRFSWFLTMTALGGLGLTSTVAPQKAEATGGLAIAATMIGAENTTPAVHIPASRPAAKLTRPKKILPTSRKKHKPGNRFIRLGQRLVNGTLACRDEFEYTGTAIDPAINGCMANDQTLKWAFGSRKDTPIGFTDHPFIDVEVPDGQQVIIQPLHLHLGKFNPLFNQYFTPWKKKQYLSISDQPLSDDTWLREQVFANDDGERIMSERILESGPGQESIPFAYRYSVDRKTSFIAGVGWITDIADTTGMSPAFAQAGYGEPDDTMGAVNITLGASYSDFTLTGGYIRAIDGMNGDDFIAQGQTTDPMAWSSELAYKTSLFSCPATLAVGYQKSSEALSHFLPEERYTTKASILLDESTRLSLEYYQDREYSSDNGPDENDAYGITTKIGFQF